MKLRFSVNQAECFRRGIDCCNSIHVLDIQPSKLTQEQRDLIADRLDGIDVCQLMAAGANKVMKRPGDDNRAVLIEAKAPDFESLMEAVKADAERVKAQLAKFGGGVVPPWD